MIGSRRFKKNRTDDEPEKRFISADEFATSSGLSLELVINQYSVLRKGMHVVPLFIADNWTAQSETHFSQISIKDSDDNLGTSSLPIILDESIEDEYSTSKHLPAPTPAGLSEEPRRSNDDSVIMDASYEGDFPETDINQTIDNHRFTPSAELDSSEQAPRHADESNNVLSISEDSNTQSEATDDPIERIRLRLKKMGSHFRAEPGLRFWARIVDLTLPYGLLCVGFQIAATRFTFFESTSNPVQVIALLFLFFPAAFLLDALVHAVFGNTLGKSLAGVRVVNRKGKKLSFSRYLARNLLLWIQGLAMMLPPLFVVTLLIQYLRVRRDKPSTYDRKSRVNVLQDPSETLQRLGFLLSVLGSILAMILILNTIGRYFLTVLQL